MDKIYKLNIYTTDVTITFDVISDIKDFTNLLAEGLEEGIVTLDTTEETKLILNSANVVAIEIIDEDNLKIIPPHT